MIEILFCGNVANIVCYRNHGFHRLHNALRVDWALAPSAHPWWRCSLQTNKMYVTLMKIFCRQLTDAGCKDVSGEQNERVVILCDCLDSSEKPIQEYCSDWSMISSDRSPCRPTHWLHSSRLHVVNIVEMNESDCIWSCDRHLDYWATVGRWISLQWDHSWTVSLCFVTGNSRHWQLILTINCLLIVIAVQSWLLWMDWQFWSVVTTDLSLHTTNPLHSIHATSGHSSNDVIGHIHSNTVSLSKEWSKHNNPLH